MDTSQIPTQTHPTPSSTPLWMDIKEPTVNFIGREKELDQLHNIFSQNTEQLVLITGICGIGKSELIRKFAKQIQIKEKNVNCVLLKGETPGMLNDSILKLANLLGVQITQEMTQINSQEILKEIINKAIKGGEKWLFFMDNVDKIHQLMLPTIRSLARPKQAMVIVSSRSKDRILDAVSLELHQFTMEEGELFIEKSLEGFEDCIETADLCETLHYLPLALQQAVAYIQAQQILSFEMEGKMMNSYGIKEYLEEYKIKANEIMHNPHHNNQSQTYLKTLAEEKEPETCIMWNITIEKLPKVKKTAGTNGI